MNLLNRSAGLAVAAAMSFLLTALADDGPAASESLGTLRPGMLADAVEQQLGKPTDIEEQPPECPGDTPLVVWDYADRGLMLVVKGGGPGATLTSISSFGKNRLSTARGITIGATYVQVMDAYPNPADPSLESFRVKLETGALEIRFSGDKPHRVTRILLTSETPMVYEEGQDCGQAVN